MGLKTKMRLTQEQAVIESFLVEPWKKLTYSDIRRISRKKSKGYVYKILDRLLEEKIILFERIGRSVIYNLNLNLLKTKSYLGFVNEYKSWNMKHLPMNVIENISSKIISPFFIFIITGSFAKQTQNKNSDLDVVIICDNAVNPKSIYASIKLESDLSIPKVHPYVFTKKEFIDMLIDEKENYGKEIARNNLIFYGGEEYYSIIKEAIKHGFNG